MLNQNQNLLNSILEQDSKEVEQIVAESNKSTNGLMGLFKKLSTNFGEG